MLLASRRSLLSLAGVIACGLIVAAAGIAAEMKRPVSSKSKAPRHPVISKPKFDPSAPKVDLFEAMDAGTVEAKLIPKDQFSGNVLITNKGDAPITVKVPDAVVGVQVLPQMMGGGMGGMGGGMGGMGGGMGGMGGGMMGQSMGGGMGGGMGGMGGGMGGMGGGMGGGGMGGMFSIPANRTIRVAMTSVCLEHGKVNPTSSMTYKLVRPSDYSDKPELAELCKQVGSGRLEQGAAQAAAWSISSGMSWQELANEMYDHIGEPDEPYFTPTQLRSAQGIVSHVKVLAAEAAKKKAAEPKTELVTRGSLNTPKKAAK